MSGYVSLLKILGSNSFSEYRKGKLFLLVCLPQGLLNNSSIPRTVYVELSYERVWSPSTDCLSLYVAWRQWILATKDIDFSCLILCSFLRSLKAESYVFLGIKLMIKFGGFFWLVELLWIIRTQTPARSGWARKLGQRSWEPLTYPT